MSIGETMNSLKFGNQSEEMFWRDVYVAVVRSSSWNIRDAGDIADHAVQELRERDGIE